MQLTDSWFRSAWHKRIDATLDLLGDYDILLLQTPPGFGKRQTIERWHRLLKGTGKVVWHLDCDPSPHPADLAHASLLSAPSQRWNDDPARSRVIIRSFCQPCPDGRILILENLQGLEPDDLQFVREHVRDLPPIANAILTCDIAELPWLASLVAAGQVKVVGCDTFRLTFDEACSRIQALCCEQFEPAALGHVYKVTDGWQVGLELAAAFILGSSDRRSAAAALPDIWPQLINWLNDTVWRRLDRHDRKFLRELAVLGDNPIDSALMHDLSDFDDIDSRTARLACTTPFFRTDERGGLALTTIALAYLQQKSGDQQHQVALHREAARILGLRTDLQAIGHALAAGDPIDAGQMLNAMLINLVAAGETRRARQWLELVPPDGFRDSDAVLAMGLLGDLDAAEQWLRALDSFSIILTARDQDKCLLLNAMVAAKRDRLDDLQHFLEKLGDDNSLNGAFKAAQSSLQLSLHHKQGKAAAFSTVALPINDERRKPENFGFYCASAVTDGLVLLDLGQSEAAIRLVSRARSLAISRLGSQTTPVIELSAILAAAHLQAGQAIQAGDLLRTWPNANLDGVDHAPLIAGYISVARIAMHDRRHADAFGALHALERISKWQRLYRSQAFVMTELARTGHLAAQPAMVRRAEQELMALLEGIGPLAPQLAAQVRLQAAIGLAEILIMQRSWSEALRWLAVAEEIAATLGRRYELAHLHCLAMGTRGAENGQGFVVQPAPPTIGEADAKTILALQSAMFGNNRGGNDASIQTTRTAVTIALTRKEQEVLELMACGFAKKHIAQAMNVSTETIKWHQKNIYAKFDIHDRHNVLKAAKDLGLL